MQYTEEENRNTEEVIRIQEKRERAELLEEFNTITCKEEVTGQIDLERKLEEPQAEIADLNNNPQVMEGELTDDVARNDIFLSQPQEDQIAILLQDCSTNWQQMIESEDLTVLKTLETYDAIDRIPVSIINHHFTITRDDEEIKGVPVLLVAAFKGNREMARLLLLHPAIDVNVVVDESGTTPLLVASGMGHVAIVDVLLLDKRVEVNKSDI
eukprot:scaffold5593_cov165-Ochromonas_danica.AAC.1